MKLSFATIVAVVLAANITVGMAQELAPKGTTATAQGQAGTNPGPSQAVIDRGAAANKYVFLFFWKDKTSQTDEAWNVLQPAVTNMADLAEVASIQVTDPAEKKIVDKYGVTRAPMPLVLAVAPCGAITKAFTKAFDEQQLRAAFVSSCAQQCLKALQDRKLVFVCVVEKTEPNAPLAIPKGVKDFKADEKLGSATEIVLVDAQDENEATFLKELEVGKLASKPITLFLAPPGALIGRFGDVSKDDLVAKLVAAQSNPCGGGSCGPGGCGPKK